MDEQKPESDVSPHSGLIGKGVYDCSISNETEAGMSFTAKTCSTPKFLQTKELKNSSKERISQGPS